MKPTEGQAAAASAALVAQASHAQKHTTSSYGSRWKVARSREDSPTKSRVAMAGSPSPAPGSPLLLSKGNALALEYGSGSPSSLGASARARSVPRSPIQLSPRYDLAETHTVAAEVSEQQLHTALKRVQDLSAVLQAHDEGLQQEVVKARAAQATAEAAAAASESLLRTRQQELADARSAVAAALAEARTRGSALAQAQDQIEILRAEVASMRTSSLASGSELDVAKAENVRLKAELGNVQEALTNQRWETWYLVVYQKRRACFLCQRRLNHLPTQKPCFPLGWTAGRCVLWKKLPQPTLPRPSRQRAQAQRAWWPR